MLNTSYQYINRKIRNVIFFTKNNILNQNNNLSQTLEIIQAACVYKTNIEFNGVMISYLSCTYHYGKNSEYLSVFCTKLFKYVFIFMPHNQT